jgi:tetratricopeptide (TPR) repeat protein
MQNNTRSKLWLSCLTIALLVSCASTGGGAGISLSEAIEQSAEKIAIDLPRGSIVAVASFETNDAHLSDYIMRELNDALFDRGITVVSRNSLEFVEKELNFQMSGAVSDETAQSIGKFFGAEVIIIGELIDAGGVYRYRTNAIHVEEARQGSAVRFDVRNDKATRRMMSTLANQQRPERQQEAEPNTPLFFIERGIALAVRGEYDLAIMNFTDAIVLNPNLIGSFMLRGRALYASVSDVTDIGENFNSVTTYGKWKVSADERKIFVLAIEDFTQSIKLASHPAPAYYERSVAYLNMGDYDNAIADVNQAIRFDPNNASAYKIRGDAYFQKRDIDHAITDYTQAIKLDPNNAVSYDNRGWAYFWEGKYDQAIADYTQAIKLDPNNADRYGNRGWANLYEGKNDRAITDYTQAIKLDPNNADRYDNRGWAYNLVGDYDRAIADHTWAIKINPNVADSYVNRGRAYEGKGDYERAIADHTQAIKINPNDASSYISRGGTYERKGDYDRAMVDYTQAIKINPNDASGYINRGMIYEGKNDYDRAIADYMAALRINPNLVEVSQILERARAQQERRR